jgi:choline dehydrogenase
MAADGVVIEGARPEMLKPEYDYVIVGAGAAGCVLANRLSEDGWSSVLAIEGGGTDIGQAKISDPRLWPTNFGTDTDWGYSTVPQPHLNGRSIVAPVGKVIGGGSSINATVWLNGDRADYDAWEAAAGPDWGFDNLIRNFKKAERYAGGESTMRGGSGMIATRTPDRSHPVTQAFITSAVACGKAERRDVNDVAQVGDVTGQNDINTDMAMRRVSAAHGYLYPALTRGNLTLLTHAAVTKLEIAGGECRGVFVSVGGEMRRIAAAKEVILSAGGIMSPKLLMLSGVGPADHLRSLGVPLVLDQPRIGANLHDHLLTRLLFSTQSANPPQTDTGHAGITWHKTNASRRGPDIQIFGRMFVPNAPEVKPDEAYAIMVGLMKPKSRGSVRLASADPHAAPVVDPNYFADPADVDAYVAGMELALAIGNGPGFAAMRKAQVSIPRAGRSDIVGHIRANAGTYYHYVGTCEMGTDASAPVDPQLRLRGISGLRVADASVMPEVNCCNTHAPTLALAERAAEIIRGQG